MTYKKIVCTLFISALFVSVTAQDSTKVNAREFYITLADFSPFQLQLKYKHQISTKKYFKIGVIDLNAFETKTYTDFANTYPTSQSGYSFGAELGIENRNVINNKFSFFRGFNLGYSFNKSIYKTFNPTIPQNQQKAITDIHKFSLSYTLGFLFNLNQNILIGADVNPMLTYSQSVFKPSSLYTPIQTTDNLMFGFSNKIIVVSVIYRLEKLKMNKLSSLKKVKTYIK